MSRADTHMDTPEPLASLDRLFIQALLRLGDAEDTDFACRLAAQAWSLLRHDYPREARRLNDVLHGLTNPRRRSREKAGAGDRVEPAPTTHSATQQGASR